MAKDAAVTVRLPLELKRRLEIRAKAQRRSVSAQMVHDLETLLADAPDTVARSTVPVLGRFRGGRVPSDDDIREVRGMLWGRMGARRP